MESPPQLLSNVGRFSLAPALRPRQGRSGADSGHFPAMRPNGLAKLPAWVEQLAGAFGPPRFGVKSSTSVPQSGYEPVKAFGSSSSGFGHINPAAVFA